MNDRKERVLKWISFGVSLSNTALYPYKKAVRFVEIQEEKAKDSLTYFDRESSLSSVADLPLEALDTPVSKKSAIDYFSQIIDYVNYAIMAWTTINALLKLDDNELSFLGLKITKGFLKVVKWVIIGAGALILISICLEKLFKSKLLGAANKKIFEWIKKALPYIKDILKIGFALYAIYLIYVLLKLKIDGKKWKINDTDKLLSGMVMLLAVLDVKWVEEKLADSKKGYIIATGVSSVAKLVKTSLIPFTTSEPLRIKSNKFEKVDFSDDTLFLYFCGTRENTDKHLDQFMRDVKAKHQIYVSGIGSSQAIYEQLYDSDLTVSAVKLGNNSQKYHFENGKRSITCIEKVYTGGDLGYNKGDAEQVVKYAFDAFKDIFNSHPKIKNVVIAGHSRGAAVALMSFLYKLAEDSNQLLSRISESKIAVFPLDPVAGQTGNAYPMGDKWTSRELYDKLYAKFSSNLSICEVWARSASMFSVLGLGPDFHPARKLLHNPSSKSLMLSRFLLGYAHSAMVIDDEKYNQYYSPKEDSPYDLLVRFLNEYIDLLPSLNNSKFTEVSKKYKNLFNKADKSIRDSNAMEYEKGMRTSYENQNGTRINFTDFIESFDFDGKSD